MEHHSETKRIKEMRTHNDIEHGRLLAYFVSFVALMAAAVHYAHELFK